MIQISEEQKILLDNLKRVVREKVAPVAAETDRTANFNREVVSLFWDLGLLQIMLPEQYDGWPQNPAFTLCLAIEEIAKACASSALLLIIQAVGSYPLIYAGNKTQKKTAEVILEDVKVPEENLLGKPGQGFAIAMGDFDMSRPAVAALALGLAEGALDYTVDYARQRNTFGKPLIEHQAIQFILAEASTLVEASRGLMEKAALAFDSGNNNTKMASMAKYFCSDAAMKITTDMVQVLGGYGYIKDYPIERMFRDAKLTQIFEGANQIQKMIIGREISKQ